MTGTLLYLHPKDLVPGDNVRADLGDLTELTASIRELGVLQPILVRAVDLPDKANVGGFYQIVAGHRRTAAAIAADVDSVPVLVDVFTDTSTNEAMLVENLMRLDLNPVEEAKGYFRLVLTGMDAPTLAARIGRSMETVTSRLALLDLDDDTLALVASGDLTLVNAEHILDAKAKGVREELLLNLAEQGVDGGNLEREAKEAVRREKLLKAADKIKVAAEKKGIPVFLDVWGGDKPDGFTRVSQHGWGYGSTQDVVKVDADLHKKEPCTGIYLNLRNTWEGKPDPIIVCTDPARHRGGDSILQEPAKAKAGKSDEQKARDAADRALAKERKEFSARLAATFTAKDIAALLPAYVLGTLGYQEILDIVKVLDIEVIKDTQGGQNAKASPNYYKTMATELAKGASAQRRVLGLLLSTRGTGYGVSEPFRATITDKVAGLTAKLTGEAAPAAGDADVLPEPSDA